MNQIRHNRILQLSRLARHGATDDDIINKALSIGVTTQTAESYLRELYARGEMNVKILD